MIEEWSIIPEFPRYQISSFGRVKGPRKILKLLPHKGGYVQVNLHIGKHKYKTRLVQQLVAKAFVDNPKPNIYRLVHHKNDNKQDNVFTNLEWTNHKGNADAAVKSGKITNAHFKKTKHVL